MDNGTSAREQIISHMKDQFNLPEEQIRTMIPPFLETLDEHLSSLEQAIASVSLEDTGRAAHTLKGALLNLGLFRAAETAQALEKAAKSGEERCDYAGMSGELRSSLQSLLSMDGSDAES